MTPLQNFPKICWWFGQNNYCPGLWKVAKSIKKSPSLVTLWRQPIISKMSISLFPTNSPINSLTCFKGKRHRGLQDHLWSLTAESDQPRVTVKNKFWRNKTVVGAKFLPTPPRSAVRIQPSANFLLNIYTFNCNEKTKIKKKEAGNGPFFKTRLSTVQALFRHTIEMLKFVYDVSSWA